MTHGARLLRSLRLLAPGLLLASAALAEPRAVVTSPSPAQISGEGNLSAQEIQQVFRSHQGQIQACFQKGLLHGVVVQGKIVLTWRIRPDGTVDEARVREGESSVKNADVSSCLVRGVTGWRFHRLGGAVSVRYALLAQVVEVEPDSDRDRRERTYFRPLMTPLGGGEKGDPPRAGPCYIDSGALELSAVSAERASVAAGAGVAPIRNSASGWVRAGSVLSEALPRQERGELRGGDADGHPDVSASPW